MTIQTFASTKQDSLDYNERNDCAVKAIAISHNVEYSLVHKLLKAEGRRNRRGTYRHQQEAVSKKLGATIIDTIPRKAGGGQITVSTIGKYFPTGRHMVFVRGHVLALVNGKVEDWTSGRKHRVLNVWTITTSKTEIEPTTDFFAVKPVPAQPKIIKQPKTGTLTGKVWEIANTMPNATRKQIITACVALGIHPATAATQYARWNKATK